MATRNIVIAPCGNRSFLFRDAWLKQENRKEFDLCLLFYHDEVLNPDLYNGVDFFFHLKDFKYHMLHKLLTDIHPEWLEQYEYFYFLDDDIGIDTIGINSMFELSRAFRAKIAQAALSKDSYCSWPIFRQRKSSFCRFVGQIEVMAPLFERESLQACLPSFIGNRSSWGVDSVWPKILNYPKDKLIVFDTVVMRHTQPVGGGELYQKIGVDPHEEWLAITQQYDAKKENYQEYGRLQLVDESHNRLKYLWHKTQELFNKGKKMVNDYDIGSRLKSQRRKLTRRLGLKP